MALQQPTDANEIETNERLKLVRQKRHTLEQLIAFTKNVVEQCQALDDLLVLIRPSQNMPDKLRAHFVVLVDSLEDNTDGELQKRLEKIDALVNKGAKNVVALTQSFDDIESHSDISERIDNIKKMAGNFRKRAKLAIAIRIALQERGLTTSRLQLEFNQEQLASRLQHLKVEEKLCRNNIDTQIQGVIKECDQLLASPNTPKCVRGELAQVKQVMWENLEHLKSGKSIESMPVNFESIEIGDTAPGAVDDEIIMTALPKELESNSAAVEADVAVHRPKVNVSQPAAKSTASRTKSIPVQKRGFFARLWKWLTSPMSTRWRDTL